VSLNLTVTVNADTRYTFTGQFLEASAAFTRRAREIERQYDYSRPIPDEVRCEHRAFVSTTVMQCAAAMETEAHEICVHGPGSYLGSDRMDLAAQKILHPIAEEVDKLSTLERFDLIMKVLGKDAFDRGKNPFQSAQLMVRLRNKLVHYKSAWGAEMSEEKLFKALEQLRHKAPPFTSSTMNFFPHRCLGADCAAWAVATTVGFLEDVYSRLGVPSRFATYGNKLVP
jgi:hypothetical protein